MPTPFATTRAALRSSALLLFAALTPACGRTAAWPVPGTDGSIQPLENLPNWQATLRIGEDRPSVAQAYVLPKRKDPNPLKIHPCSNQPIPPEEWDTGDQP